MDSPISDRAGRKDPDVYCAINSSEIWNVSKSSSIREVGGGDHLWTDARMLIFSSCHNPRVRSSDAASLLVAASPMLIIPWLGRGGGCKLVFAIAMRNINVQCSSPRLVESMTWWLITVGRDNFQVVGIGDQQYPPEGPAAPKS